MAESSASGETSTPPLEGVYMNIKCKYRATGDSGPFFRRQKSVPLVEQLPVSMFIQCFCIALHVIPQHFAVVECHDYQHLPPGFVGADERQSAGIIGVSDLPYLKWSD